MNKDVLAELLDNEIEAQLTGLGAMPPGCEETTRAVDDLVKLYKLRIDETKSKHEIEEKAEEANFKKEQLAEQVKDRYFRLGTAMLELVLPLAFYGVWMKKGFKFEETGSFTSTTFKGLINRFRPTKK